MDVDSVDEWTPVNGKLYWTQKGGSVLPSFAESPH
jgi:hypothetical protein